MEYVLHLIVLIQIFAVVALSFDLIAGQGGLLSLAHATFFGVGAYVSALLSLSFGIGYLPGMAMGMLAAALLALALSLPLMRLHGDYFMIATFAFQMVFFTVANNWSEVTGGPSGLPDIPAVSMAVLWINSQWAYIAIGSLQLSATIFIVWRLAASPYGLLLRGIREDELFVESLGKNTNAIKIKAFVLSAALAASAGSLFAFYFSYIDPTSFTLSVSILVLTMVILGGAGTIPGPVVGAVALVLLPEALRFVGFPSSTAANLQQLLYGVLLLILVLVRPRGLMGRRGFLGSAI